MSLTQEDTQKSAARAPKAAKPAKPLAALPTTLSYKRSFEPSLATLTGVTPDGRDIPVEVYEIQVTGAQGAYKNGYGDNFERPKAGAKEAHIDQPNPKLIHKATLPLGCERLEIRFGVVVDPAILKPSNSSVHPIYDKLQRFVDLSIEKGVVRDLAVRYVWNLVNGRAAWNNGSMEDMKTRVVSKDFDETFSCYDYPLENCPDQSTLDEPFMRLVGIVEAGLTRKGRGATLLRVTIGGTLPAGAELWPSQAFVQKEEKTRNSTKNARVLQSRPVWHEGRMVDQAYITSGKIGNALRTIDEWHPQFDRIGIIPVEVYGFFRDRLVATRRPSQDGIENSDALWLLKSIDVLIGQLEAGVVSNETRYVLASLIRGGLYSASSGEDA